MYLTINNQNYPLRRRKLTDQSVTYYGMTEMPETVSGTITMYRDDGFEMSVDDADSYARQVKSREFDTCYWWARSPVGDRSDTFCCVSNTGGNDPLYASQALGVAFAFCF